MSEIKTVDRPALYAYFGELGIFNDDIPGHTFYQLGLLDSISSVYDINKFDFYNYLDGDLPNMAEVDQARPIYPDDKIAEVFSAFTNQLIRNYRPTFDSVILGIKRHEYSKLFLKARFRNLSTLSKKYKDAYRFEHIIKTALAAGYTPSEIVIVDTDLSLSPEFIKHINDLGISRIIPSIDIPGIGIDFLNECLEVHKNNMKPKYPNIFYYGNLSFANYKEGHSKNPIIISIINSVDDIEMFNGSKFEMVVATKKTEELVDYFNSNGLKNVDICHRTNRERIWNTYSQSLVSINVSKDLYLTEGFIPARVYESVIFGVIPVSYKLNLHPAMEFDTVFDFFEICKFLTECSVSDYYKILEQIANRICRLP